MQGMEKRGVFFRLRVRKLRKEFDGRTQAVRGALIAELEELYQKALGKCEKAKKEKNKIQWAQVAAYIAKTINIISREYDANKILARLDVLEAKVSELREKDKQSGKRGRKARRGRKNRSS